MMEFFNDNKNILFGLIAAVVTGIGIVHWVDFSGDSAQKNDTEAVAEKINDEPFEEIVVVGEAEKNSDFAEKVNEAAVNNQVNAAQKLSDDTDGLSEK